MHFIVVHVQKFISNIYLSATLCWTSSRKASHTNRPVLCVCVHSVCESKRRFSSQIVLTVFGTHFP